MEIPDLRLLSPLPDLPFKCAFCSYSFISDRCRRIHSLALHLDSYLEKLFAQDRHEKSVNKYSSNIAAGIENNASFLGIVPNFVQWSSLDDNDVVNSTTVNNSPIEQERACFERPTVPIIDLRTPVSDFQLKTPTLATPVTSQYDLSASLQNDRRPEGGGKLLGGPRRQLVNDSGFGSVCSSPKSARITVGTVGQWRAMKRHHHVTSSHHDEYLSPVQKILRKYGLVTTSSHSKAKFEPRRLRRLKTVPYYCIAGMGSKPTDGIVLFAWHDDQDLLYNLTCKSTKLLRQRDHFKTLQYPESEPRFKNRIPRRFDEFYFGAHFRFMSMVPPRYDSRSRWTRLDYKRMQFSRHHGLQAFDSRMQALQTQTCHQVENALHLLGLISLAGENSSFLDPVTRSNNPLELHSEFICLCYETRCSDYDYKQRQDCYNRRHHRN